MLHKWERPRQLDNQVTTRPGNAPGIRVKDRNQPGLLVGLHPMDKKKIDGGGERPFDQRFPEPFQRRNSLPLPCRNGWKGWELWVGKEGNVKRLWDRGCLSTCLQAVSPQGSWERSQGVVSGRTDFTVSHRHSRYLPLQDKGPVCVDMHFL